MEANVQNDISSSGTEDSQKSHTHTTQIQTQTSLLSYITRKRPNDVASLDNNFSTTSDDDSSHNNANELNELDSSDEEDLKKRACEALDVLI